MQWNHYVLETPKNRVDTLNVQVNGDYNFSMRSSKLSEYKRQSICFRKSNNGAVCFVDLRFTRIYERKTHLSKGAEIQGR